MVRLGSAPQQSARSRATRSDRRRIPAKEPTGRTPRAGGIPRRQEDPHRISRPNGCCKARPRASSLGPFTLMDAVGSGSMGTVYKAQSKTDNNWYAVKVLPRRSMWNVRIARRKVRSFEQCKHPAVVPVRRRRHGRRHALPGLALRRGRNARQNRRTAGQDSARAWPFTTPCKSPRGSTFAISRDCFTACSSRRTSWSAPTTRCSFSTSASAALLAETEGESLVDTMSTSNSVTSGLDFAAPESIMDPTEPDAGRRSVQPGLRAVLHARRASCRSPTAAWPRR